MKSPKVKAIFMATHERDQAKNKKSKTIFLSLCIFVTALVLIVLATFVYQSPETPVVQYRDVYQEKAPKAPLDIDFENDPDWLEFVESAEKLAAQSRAKAKRKELEDHYARIRKNRATLLVKHEAEIKELSGLELTTSKASRLDLLEKEILLIKAAGERLPALRLSVGSIGKLVSPNNNGYSLYRDFYLNIKVLQVLNDNSFLAQLGDNMFALPETVWIDGVSTAGMTDGATFKIKQVVKVIGTKRYTTVRGGSKTVFHIEAYELPKAEDMKPKG